MFGTVKWILPMVLVAVGASGAPAASTQTLASSTAVQVVDDLSPARDLPTPRADLTLINQCIDGGRAKADCLCVTQVLKYELPLREYRLASQLFTKHSETHQSALKLTLMQQGFQPDEIARLLQYTAKFTQEADFKARCQAADTYFKAEKRK